MHFLRHLFQYVRTATRAQLLAANLDWILFWEWCTYDTLAGGTMGMTDGPGGPVIIGDPRSPGDMHAEGMLFVRAGYEAQDTPTGASSKAHQSRTAASSTRSPATPTTVGRPIGTPLSKAMNEFNSPTARRERDRLRDFRSAHGEHRADNMGEPNKTTVAEAAAGTREHHNPVPTPRLDSAESKRVRSKRKRVRFSPVQ